MSADYAQEECIKQLVPILPIPKENNINIIYRKDFKRI